jgi:hypothetical protein
MPYQFASATIFQGSQPFSVTHPDLLTIDPDAPDALVQIAAIMHCVNPSLSVTEIAGRMKRSEVASIDLGNGLRTLDYVCFFGNGYNVTYHRVAVTVTVNFYTGGGQIDDCAVSILGGTGRLKSFVEQFERVGGIIQSIVTDSGSTLYYSAAHPSDF